MSFRLKNAEASYQLLMTRIIKPLIGRTVEVYIDDIEIKRKTHFEHLYHLEEALELLCKYEIKLNPLKCALEVQASSLNL